MLDGMRRKLDHLFSEGRLTTRDVRHQYEGLFLRAYVAFEGFLEELFVGLLVGTLDRPRNVQARVGVRGHTVARTVIGREKARSNRGVDWMPFGDTAERADAYFRGGRPFSLLSQGQKDTLTRAQFVRNVIAHRSRSAQQQFEGRVLPSVSGAGARDVGTFLLSIKSYTPPAQTWLEFYLAQFRTIADDLCRCRDNRQN
jgi:hypothetical protein